MVDTDSRLTEVEIRIEYQERLIETLNQVILDLRGEIASLRRDFEKLCHQALDSQLPLGPANEKPPHY